ncbi:fungal-specific transcription factor domain-containing protein, partial [Hysterangium stoloniferum]
ACHQCRRRKLKCDAQRPCSTCLRSHANARANGAASVPPQPDCTYDEIPEPRPQTQDPPKSRYERLESRIDELESMLRQRDMAAQHLGHADFRNTIAERYSRSSLPASLAHLTSYADMDPNHQPIASSTPVSSLGATGSVSISHENLAYTGPLTRATNSPTQDVELLRDLFWPSWPARLPTPELLEHLVDVFFASLPHASRIFHKETFIRSLSLQPTAPGFPETCILHAICAVASLFTSAVAPQPLPNLDERPAEEIFQEKYRRAENRDDSFGEMQAKYAKEAQSEAMMLGEGLFSGLQATVILSWYYLYHARWADVWITTGEALRYCVPLGLNVCKPLLPLIRPWKANSMFISPSRTGAEDETRRNTFWLAYSSDRIHAAGHEFAMTLDDEDITQVLPCSSQEFNEGLSPPVEERQRLGSPRVLTSHPPEHTDSFVLYVKAMALLSKVKIFNSRFRAKFQNAGEVDPRDTPVFKGLDGIISTFRISFPPGLREPIVGGVVDNHLYLAHLIPHTAMLLLHDPHADFMVHDQSCEKLTVAAHAILQMVYAVCSTNYDITLLDPSVVWCWYTAAQELVQEMRHARETGQGEQATFLRSEIEAIRTALARMGERLPLGYRQTKLLDELLSQDMSECNLTNPAAHNGLFSFGGLEYVDPGSLERLMYGGMR